MQSNIENEKTVEVFPGSIPGAAGYAALANRLGFVTRMKI
jgi:hypothetical protein